MAAFIDGNVSTLEFVRNPIGSRNQAQNLWVALADGARRVGLKACDRNPRFLNRELVLAQLRERFGLPHYKLERQEGLLLRHSGANCPPVAGWETTPYVLIEFGVAGRRPNLDELDPNQVVDRSRFYRQLGEWCAFNILTCATDRHMKNFVYDLDTQTLYSVDNEDLGGNPESDFGNYRAIAGRFWQNLPEQERDQLIESFADGFLERWESMVRNATILDSFGDDENAVCARERFQLDPSLILQRLALGS